MSERKREKVWRFRRPSLIFCTSMTVSRVLYLTVIYLRAAYPAAPATPGAVGPTYCSHTGVAPDRVYSIGHSRADGCALTAPFHPQRDTCIPPGRSISVALFLRSLWAGVTRYPCPVEAGLSSQRAFQPRRATVCHTRTTIFVWRGACHGKMHCCFAFLRYTIYEFMCRRKDERL